MIRYIDWVQTVLYDALKERPSREVLTIGKLGAELGLPLDGVADAERNENLMALDHVLRDLAPHGFVEYKSDGYSVSYPSAARRFRTEPLSATWTELRSGFLASDDEAFLTALASLSEKPAPDYADVVDVDARDVFAALGWDWDGRRAVEIYGHLKECFFVEGRVYGGPAVSMRITYAGLVRALDETGHLLREAEDHLQTRRLRAAGCIASVELERRLKELVGTPPAVSRKRDPTLEDYNQAAYGARLIDQETWESISTLAVIRKRCVHVLDREPDTEEVRRLVEGVEVILRRYPGQQ